MGHFYGLAILPADVDITDEEVVKKAVGKLIEPYAPKGDEHPIPGVWFDSYSCTTKEWYSNYSDWKSDFPNAIEKSKLLIIPNNKITFADMAYAIITPKGEWFQSEATWRAEDLEWGSQFLNINDNYHGHYSVVLYFKC